MLRLAWVSEIKPECCQDLWHSGCGFSKQEQGTKKEILSQQFVWSNNLEFQIGKYILWLLLKMLSYVMHCLTLCVHSREMLKVTILNAS